MEGDLQLEALRDVIRQTEVDQTLPRTIKRAFPSLYYVAFRFARSAGTAQSCGAANVIARLPLQLQYTFTTPKPQANFSSYSLGTCMCLRKSIL